MTVRTHAVTIQYCPRCKWLARAAWYAQELLTTFDDVLVEVALRPADGGVFVISVGDAVVMDRGDEGFLEAKVVKQRVRDLVAPAHDLGHADRSVSPN